MFLWWDGVHVPSKGALVNVPSRGSLSRGLCMGGPLMRAVATGMVSCCQLLLKAGADVNAQDKQEQTPLIYAANGDFEFMGFHLSYPLHLSILSQDTSQCLKLLLDAGADVNKQDNNGFTAVHSVTFSINVECLKYLIEAGANVHIGKKSPLSVIQHAMMQILKTEVPPPIPPPIHHIPHPKERKQFSRDALNCLRLLFAAGACVNKITWITSPQKLKVYQRSKRESFVSITSPDRKKHSMFRNHFMFMCGR